MNLYLRLLLLLLSYTQRQPRCGLHEPVTTRLRVYPNDLDINLHMNNGRYLTLMDLGRLDFMRKVGLFWPTTRRGWAAILGANQMIYLRPLKVWQRFTLETQLECWDDKWFVMTQRFVADGRLCAIGRVRGLFRGPKGNIAVPQVIALAHTNASTSPMPSEATQQWLQQLVPPPKHHSK
jgi:acyl-CoA thioesterase FadM